MLVSSTTMATDGLRLRQPPAQVPVIEKLKAQRTTANPPTPSKQPHPTQHPAGDVKHGLFTQALRMFLFAAYFSSSILASVYTHAR